MAAALVPVIFVGNILFVEISAFTRASAFCRNTPVGSSAEHLSERALAVGAVDLNDPATWVGKVQREVRWVGSPNGSYWLPVTFLGFDYSEGPTRHYCAIAARNGVVVSKEVQHLD